MVRTTGPVEDELRGSWRRQRGLLAVAWFFSEATLYETEEELRSRDLPHLVPDLAVNKVAIGKMKKLTAGLQKRLGDALKSSKTTCLHFHVRAGLLLSLLPGNSPIRISSPIL